MYINIGKIKMTSQNPKNRSSQLPGIIIGLFFLFTGVYTLITGYEWQRGDAVFPAWGAWFTAPFGLWALTISLHARWRNKQEAKREAETAALEEKEREAQGHATSGADESESKKDAPPRTMGRKR